MSRRATGSKVSRTHGPGDLSSVLRHSLSLILTWRVWHAVILRDAHTRQTWASHIHMQNRVDKDDIAMDKSSDARVSRYSPGVLRSGLASSALGAAPAYSSRPVAPYRAGPGPLPASPPSPPNWRPSLRPCLAATRHPQEAPLQFRSATMGFEGRELTQNIALDPVREAGGPSPSTGRSTRSLLIFALPSAATATSIAWSDLHQGRGASLAVFRVLDSGVLGLDHCAEHGKVLFLLLVCVVTRALVSDRHILRLEAKLERAMRVRRGGVRHESSVCDLRVSAVWVHVGS